jgi:hypothetical protein
MATDHHHLNSEDPLRNPEVDYERSDLSARAIVMFLAGLLVCCIFIEIVIWGMFHFLRSSEGIFAQSHSSPMAVPQKAAPETLVGARMQNTPPASVANFPEPRLQTHDWVAMEDFLASEQKVLYPDQPFADQSGVIHIPINDAMKLVEQRLQVRPNSPPPDFTSQTDAGTPSGMLQGSQNPAQDRAKQQKEPARQ